MKNEKQQCRFNFPFKEERKSYITFEKIGNSEAVRARIVHKRNDSVMNVHNRTMLENWQANVDMQIILDHYAAVNYMAKYATKAEQSGKSLQSLLKTIITNGKEGDKSSTALKSAIIRSVGQRDIGQGEASRILMSGHHCESTFLFVHVSLELNVQRITRNAEGDLTAETSLLRQYGKRYQLMENNPEEHPYDQPNFLEFARHFYLTKGKLLKNTPSRTERTIVVTFPNNRKCEKHLPGYVDFCRSAYLKYSEWTEEELPDILNDEIIVQKWDDFEETCTEAQRKYFFNEMELQNRFQIAQDNLDPIIEEPEDLLTVDWQIASGMRPENEIQGIQETPDIDNQYDWHKNRVIQYTQQQLATASSWIEKTLEMDGTQGLSDLPNVTR